MPSFGAVVAKPLNFRRRHAIYLDGLRPAGRARHDADAPPRNGEAIGKERHQRFVRRAIDGRGVNSHAQRTVEDSGNLVPRRARLESNAES